MKNPAEASPPREGRTIGLFVVASVLGHVALVAAAPSSIARVAATAPDEVVFMDLQAPEPEPVAPLPEPEPEPEPEIEPEPEPAAPEPIREPEPQPAVTEEAPEPVEATEPSTEPSAETAEQPAATAEVATDGVGAAETVASAEGGLAVDRAAGAGTSGTPDGATRTEPVRPRMDPGALRAWRISALRALGRPQATLALRRTGLEGIAVVAFRIDSHGKVVGVRLYRSSGHDLVDEAALAFARSRRALPTPPAPWETREVRLPIRYRAEGRG